MEFTDEMLINGLFALISAIIGGTGVAALFRRKLIAARADQISANTKIDLVSFYKTEANDLSAKVEALSKKYDKLHESFQASMKQIEQLQSRERILVHEIETLKSKERSLQRLVDSFINNEE